MSLSRIIGHEQPKRLLRRAFAEGRVPTAYLFVGPPNLGKSTVAVEFAKLLNCLSPLAPSSVAEADCCDACEACQRIQAGSFADVLCVRPVVRIGSGAQTQTTEFEGAVLTTDQIGEVITRANLHRTRGRHKVLIIARAETMNPEAANRLLKTLEEPPEGTLLILTSSNPSALLPTIASRCQRVAFHAVSPGALVAGLRAQVPEATPELVETVARLSSGRPGWALTLLRKPRALDVRRRLVDLVASLPDQPLIASLALGEELLSLCEAWWKAINEGDEAADVLQRSGDRARRVAMVDVLDLMASILRDVMLLCEGGEERVLNVDVLPTLRSVAAGTSASRARRAAAAVQQVQRHIRGNANLKLACELLIVQVMQLLRVRAVA